VCLAGCSIDANMLIADKCCTSAGHQLIAKGPQLITPEPEVLLWHLLCWLPADALQQRIQCVMNSNHVQHSLSRLLTK
jgi:hypothetical protein